MFRFVVFIFLYIVIGFTYNSVADKQRGVQALPHYEFWLLSATNTKVRNSLFFIELRNSLFLTILRMALSMYLKNLHVKIQMNLFTIQYN